MGGLMSRPPHRINSEQEIHQLKLYAEADLQTRRVNAFVALDHAGARKDPAVAEGAVDEIPLSERICDAAAEREQRLLHGAVEVVAERHPKRFRRDRVAVYRKCRLGANRSEADSDHQ